MIQIPRCQKHITGIEASLSEWARGDYLSMCDMLGSPGDTGRMKRLEAESGHTSLSTPEILRTTLLKNFLDFGGDERAKAQMEELGSKMDEQHDLWLNTYGYWRPGSSVVCSE